jgi:hypothetical protein
MDIAYPPYEEPKGLLGKVAIRDLADTRRNALLKLLRHECYLTRQQLMVRVEGLLGKGCFGDSAGGGVFFRDMRSVKRELVAAGYRVLYSRSRPKEGYYLQGQPAISEELAEILRRSAAEVDPAQIAIFRRMTPGERFRLGCSVTDAALNAVAYRIRQRQPGISQAEAYKLALQAGYRYG